MAGGYTPAFASLYTGTLYGKWPTAPVWASLLPLIDSHGHIEMTHEAISGMTGWPIDLLRLGISELEKPDPGSRSPAEEGCRLVRLDPARAWGWRVVNVQKYRERARDHGRVTDGRNAEKLRNWRTSKRNPAKPGETRGNRATLNSDSDSDSDSDSEKNKSAAVAALVVLHESLPTEEWDQWMALRRKRRWPTDSLTLKKQLEVLRERDTETQRQIINASINSGWQGLFPPKGSAAKKAQRDAPTTAELEAREAARARS